MPPYDLPTQIFYLNRLFEVLSDGYMQSVISLNETALAGQKELPFSTLGEDQKVLLPATELEGLLDGLFADLYQHARQFTAAPQVFAQDWNNAFVLKSIEETKMNILAYVEARGGVLKTSHTLEKDDFQVIELVQEAEQKKDVFFFQRWFH